MKIQYLQRGQIKNSTDETKSGVDRHVKWVYMGNSSFEGSSLSDSLSRIRAGEHEVSKIEIDGISLIVVHKVDELDTIVETTKGIISDSIPCIEYPYLSEHWGQGIFGGKSSTTDFYQRINIWWEIHDDFVIWVDVNNDKNSAMTEMFLQTNGE